MYYLKCNNCGYLNRLENQNLLFCSNCNKKLENNFRDWQRKNDDKTFEDFKSLVCVSEEEIKNQSAKESSPKKLKYWLVFIVVFLAMYAIAHFAGDKLASFLSLEKTSQEVLSQKWIREEYGSYALIVETPVIMTEMELELPDFVKEIIEEQNVYQYASAKGFKVFIQSVKYKIEGSLQAGADGAVNEMRIQKGVTGFDYTEEDIFYKNIKGIKQTGNFKQNGIPVEFINTMYLKGFVMWQVMVAYQTDDEVGKTAAKRVIESVEIKGF